MLSLVIAASVMGQEADLGVQKLGPDQAPPNSDVTYTLTVFNGGPDDAVNVALSDPIPAGMSLVTRTQDSGPAFSCDVAIDCTIASFAAGATATFTFVFHIDSGTEFLNVATVTSETFDPNEENDQSVAFTAVALPQGDLSVTKTAPPTTPPDADVTFLITLANNGPDAAENVVLTDNLPAPLTFVSFVQDSGPTMSCGVSTCTVASFPAGATATFSLTGHVPPGTPGGTEITNFATVASDNDPTEENNGGTTTVVVSAADVRVEKTGPPAATAGTTITYEVTVTNDGPDVALNVIVDDPQLCAVVNCSIGPLGIGASVVLTGDVTIPPSATSWSNTAVVTTDSFDPDLANNTSTVPTTITQSADIRVMKTGPASVAAATELTYTITVTNDGPSDASDVVLTDTLPAGTTLVSSSCGANPCAIGALASGASVVVTLVVYVDANAAGPLSNEATATATTSDPSPANNTSIFETAVTPASADLSVVKTGPVTIVASTDLAYSLTVTNDGPSDAAGVVLTDILPAGTTFVSSTCGANPCAIGALPSGASVVVTLVANVDADATGPLVNTATVTATTSDPSPANDTSTFETAVTPAPADLSITKTADFPESIVGANATYTIVVTNNGPGAADDVVVTDELPAGTTLVSSSAGCSGTTTVTCAVGTLAAGASATIEIVVTLPSTPGTVTNTASVSTSSTDPAGGNDAASTNIEAHLPTEAIPTLSPIALALLALAIASVVLVVLRRGA